MSNIERNDNNDVENDSTSSSSSSNSKMWLKSTWFQFLVIIMLPVAISAIMNLESFVDIETPPPDYGSGSMFDTIASRYDMINRVLALRMDVGWRRRMIQIIQKRLEAKINSIEQQQQPPPIVLDLATGTADVALMIAKEIPSAKVWGTDPSNGMLSFGRDKVKQAGLQDRVTLLWGDARDLYMYEKDHFDAATMAFGIRNVPEREKALCEIYRVLKKDATFCVLEFSEPDESFGLLGSIARAFIRHIVPIVGGVLSGKPREYLHLQNSIKDFPTPKEFGEMLESLQCNNNTDSDKKDVQQEKQRGAFVLDDLIQLNFGSVQLYVATKV